MGGVLKALLRAGTPANNLLSLSSRYGHLKQLLFWGLGSGDRKCVLKCLSYFKSRYFSPAPGCTDAHWAIQPIKLLWEENAASPQQTWAVLNDHHINNSKRRWGDSSILQMVGTLCGIIAGMSCDQIGAAVHEGVMEREHGLPCSHNCSWILGFLCSICSCCFSYVCNSSPTCKVLSLEWKENVPSSKDLEM